ncbi:MAG TPA: ATP-binding protein [Vicinamibacterales bacterium]|jgi:PAS domain S-box-containing protein
MRRVVRPEYTADYLALAYGLAYCGWLCVRTPGTPATLFVAEVAFYPLGLAVGWLYLRNAGVPGLERRTRLGWTLLGFGAFVLWILGATWSSFIGSVGSATDPAWDGPLEILQQLLLVAAFLVFPGRTVTSRGRRRLAADFGLILVAGFVLAYHYGTRAAARASPASPSEVAYVQSVLDWVVFVALAVGVLQKREGATRGAFLWLLVANTLYLAANYQLAGTPTYHSGDSVDGIWFAAWACRWTAARSAWHRYRAAPVTSLRAADTPVSDLRGGLFSYALVAGTFALLVGRVTFGEREHLEMFVLSATVMAGLLLIRQVVELRENRRVFEGHLAQEARFRSLVQNASDVVLIIDERECVSYVSASADRILGPRAIVPGVRLADLLPNEDVADLAATFAKAPGGVARRQTRLRAASGEWRAVEIAATDLRADPAVGGIVLNCRDVTERSELEDQLRQAQKLDAVGHLAGGLAHDFNNVLTVIRGYAQLVRDDFPPSSRAGMDLQNIEEAVDRAAAVTQKLLAFSREQAVHRTVLDLNAVLRGLSPLLRQLLTDRIEVDIDFGVGLWTIRADQSQMEQVIVNLVSNARDAMPQGGRVRISTANRILTAPMPATGGLPAGDYIALVVSDQGTGMSDEVRERIFEPFFSTKPKDEGLGLGLAMVHGIVTHSGGRVVVESAVGRGTTCTILLPRGVEDRAS